MTSLASLLICRLNVTNPKENHMIDKHKEGPLTVSKKISPCTAEGTS